MIKIILKEGRSLLNEVTADQAMATINSKATRKQIYQLERALFPSLHVKPDSPSEQQIQKAVEGLYQMIKVMIPRDIQENEKGLTILWLKRIFLENVQMYNTYFYSPAYSNEYTNIKYDIEKYFQWKNFVMTQKRDLNKVESFEELNGIVMTARPLFKAWQEKQLTKDAGAGTETLNPSDYWLMYIANNKGAACELGKGTDWCTAAPGLNYFEEYYKPEDPLFIFVSKDNPRVRYQAHFGTDQFMDARDEPIRNVAVVNLVNDLITKNPELVERYPIIEAYLRREGLFELLPDYEGPPKRDYQDND